MIKILFWNTGGNDGLLSIMGSLVEKYDVDIALLAEMKISIDAFVKEFNEVRELSFHASPSVCERIKVFSRYSQRFIKPIEESRYFTMRQVSLPGSEDFILVAAHLSSRLYQSLESQNTMCIELANDIRGVEERLGNDRTVVIGDMNTNPFDFGMVAAFGLHGMMSQGQAEKRTRTVGGREYPLFYNPMWSYMGDLSEGPPGTYHYERSEQVNYGWNMFDQVLVRPSMIPRFDFGCLEIVTSIGEESLLTERGIPDKSRSDHLPIVFGIKL